MRRHTVDGQRMLARDRRRWPPSRTIVRASHERWDGEGYPDGLAGEAIPLAARIVSACDAFNAMTTDRPYRKARRFEDARAELIACAGYAVRPGVVGRSRAAQPALDGGVRSLAALRRGAVGVAASAALDDLQRVLRRRLAHGRVVDLAQAIDQLDPLAGLRTALTAWRPSSSCRRAAGSRRGCGRRGRPSRTCCRCPRRSSGR